MKFEAVLQRHCARAVPLIVIDNAIDELATVRQILAAVEADEDGGHELLYIWSMSDGLRTANAGKAGKFSSAEKYLQDAVKSQEVNGFTVNPVAALTAIKLIVRDVNAAGKGERCGFLFYMGDRVISQADNDDYNRVSQLLMDLRDSLKAQQSCIYMIGIDFTIPKELKEHIVILQAPTPDDDKYGSIVDECYTKYTEALKESDPKITVPVLEIEERGNFIEALKGMSPFAAEQTVYLSTDMQGMHLEEMRRRAIQTINSTRGLSVYNGDGRGFDAIGGLDSIKDYGRKLLGGKLKMKLVVYVDEVEKVIAGSTGGDTSGISQNFLGTLLSEMQDTNALGMLLTGVYGCAKSEFAKRFGEEAGTMCVHLDLAGMKDSLVGNSEANLRRAMNVIRDIGGTDGGIVYLATCNRIGQLPPEFKRRFNLGTFFFYFPNEEEKQSIWNIYMRKYSLNDLPAEVLGRQWTGAEIESCCRLAYLMNSTIEDAAARIVPVAMTARDEIDSLVAEAEGRFLAVSNPGVFTRPAVTHGKVEGKRKSTFV